MEELIVRDYSRSDYPDVMRIWKDTGMGGAGRGDDQKVIERSIVLGGRLLLLVDSTDNRIIGTSWMTFDGRRIHLHHFGIDPPYQGKGLSKILLKESLRHVREQGCQVKLEVQQSNHKAVNLYSKMGFARLGDYDIYIIRDIDSISLIP